GLVRLGAYTSTLLLKGGGEVLVAQHAHYQNVAVGLDAVVDRVGWGDGAPVVAGKGVDLRPKQRLFRDPADRIDHALGVEIGLWLLKELLAISAVRIIDKQPLNFWQLGLAAIALPHAKIIHCTRDIRPNGFSIYSQNFNVHQRWSTDLEDIATYWRGYRRLMAHWEAATSLQMMEAPYEAMVQDPEGQARQLLDFLELPWDPSVLAFHESSRAVQTPSRWQVRQPIYTSSKARWEHYEAHLAPLIAAAREVAD
ncbi:MAG: sulfotransferase, partial [Pseudomonadota bacterium]